MENQINLTLVHLNNALAELRNIEIIQRNNRFFEEPINDIIEVLNELRNEIEIENELNRIDEGYESQ